MISLKYLQFYPQLSLKKLNKISQIIYKSGVITDRSPMWAEDEICNILLFVLVIPSPAPWLQCLDCSGGVYAVEINAICY